jgi:hypothetical protein
MKSYTKSELKEKITLAEQKIKAFAAQYSAEPVQVFSYGAYDIDPKHLVFWVSVQSDAMKIILQETIEWKQELSRILKSVEYPEAGISGVHIGVESQESVDRESAGNWWHHFK